MNTTSTSENLLRGGQFLVKESAPSDIFTPEDFSQEQRMMIESVKEFVDREIWPHKARFEQKDYGLTLEVMKKIGDLGLLGVAVPEAYGGLGMGFVTTMLVCDYISGSTGSIATAFGAHTGIGTMPITLYGTEEQKQKYVPKLATGQWFGAYCLTEPGAGSDANSGKTKAVLSTDGSHYLINGQKMWISNAGFCSLFIVFARIEDDKNISAFLVENDPSNGISLGEEEHKLGIHSSSTRQVFFSETKVTVDNMLGARGEGFKIAMNALNVGRIKLAGACLDAQRRIISNAVNYANERVQFKKPIAQFGAIKFKIAEMAAAAFVDESATYRASKNIEDRIALRVAGGNTHQEAELKGVEEYAIECSILKVAVSESAQRCADEGIQIYGGMGFSADTPMEAAWRDARITRIYEGTNEINRMLCVGMLIKKAMKGHVDLLGPAMAVADELTGIPSFETPDFSQDLAQEKAIIDSMKKVFLMVAGHAVQTFGPELEEHQQLLLAAADIMIAVYMCESGLLRAQKTLMSNTEKGKAQADLVKLYVYNAVDLVQKKAKEAIVSASTGDAQRMMLMGLKRFTKYHEYPNVVALRESIADRVIVANTYPF